jgi:hypothetical protein
VVVDKPGRLEVRVADDRADESEPVPAEILAEPLGELGLRRDL